MSLLQDGAPSEEVGRYYFAMKDVIHSPVPVDKEYSCVRCGQAIPLEVCLAGAGRDIVDIGGMGTMFVPYDGGPGSILCTHPGVDEVRRLSEALVDAVVTDAPLEPGEQRTERLEPSAFEQTIRRKAANNFWAMREMTRPTIDGDPYNHG